MKKAIKTIVIGLIAGAVSIQFFAVDTVNPPVAKGETLEAAIAVPVDVSQILVRSCNDCHTNTTVYPWYSYVQPFGWFLKGHIDDGRNDLNFSIFNSYSHQKKINKLDEICGEVESKSMPLPSYLWIHGDAALSASEIRVLCDWATDAKEKIAL